MADKTKSPFTDQERFLLDVQRRKDMAELYPDSGEAQWLRERARLAQANPDGPEARQIVDEARLGKLYADKPDADSVTAQSQNKEASTDVTPEQKASVDKALGEVQLSGKIGGATNVSSNPVPNEPTPMDKARDIGQDLQKQGVTIDK
jgi:hypothetical protein